MPSHSAVTPMKGYTTDYNTITSHRLTPERLIAHNAQHC